MKASEKKLDESEEVKLHNRLARLNKRDQECGSRGDCLYRSVRHQLSHRKIALAALPAPTPEAIKASALSWLGSQEQSVCDYELDFADCAEPVRDGVLLAVLVGCVPCCATASRAQKYGRKHVRSGLDYIHSSHIWTQGCLVRRS